MQGLTIGELSTRTGVATSALRFYEEKGLIRAERSESGHRRYLRATIRRVAFIVFAQRIGLTLEDVANELSRLPDHTIPHKADWARLSGRWVARIDKRVEELLRLRDSLTSCIGCGCLSLDACTLSNPGDRAARKGPGPREWLVG